MPALTEDQRKLREAALDYASGRSDAFELALRYAAAANPPAILALLAQVEAAPSILAKTWTDVGQSHELWEAALENCAVYVENHCVDGDNHSKAIRGMLRPVLASPAVEQATSDQAGVIAPSRGEPNSQRDAQTSPWISVEDRLPGAQGQDSEEVMCFLSGHCALTDMECRQGAGWGIRLGWYDAEKGMFRAHGRLDASVTHWMPLPAAPKGQP